MNREEIQMKRTWRKKIGAVVALLAAVAVLGTGCGADAAGAVESRTRETRALGLLLGNLGFSRRARASHGDLAIAGRKGAKNPKAPQQHDQSRRHRRRGKHGYVPEKAPHRPLPECQPHSIPRGPEQAAES